MKWIHQRGVLNFMEMTDFSLELREQLSELAIAEPPEVEDCLISPEGTKKYLIKLDSGSMIEMVIIPERKRLTLCISSQAGCALQCTFCATGAQGFERNLTPHEIIGQLWIANFYQQPSQQISNVVFMGMGEPLLNVIPVLSSISIMQHQNAYGLSKRRITLSTSGIVPEIKKLASRTDVSLAISLHAANDKLRDEIVPINKKYTIKELMKACHYYLNAGTQERHVMFEYVMLKGVNDSLEQARSLSKLINFWFQGESAKVNLIPFNPFPETEYTTSSDATIDKFQDILYRSGIRTTTRRTRGDDVDAACGQLAGKVVDKSRRSAGRD
jgi:23S rRNA (adenine2503-C2)-methyltransferase